VPTARHSHLLLATFLIATGCARSGVEVRAVGSAPVPAAEALDQGRSLFARGEYALAVTAFRRAARFAPENPEAYQGLAASYEAIGRADLGSRYREVALAVAPADATAQGGATAAVPAQSETVSGRSVTFDIAALPVRAATGGDRAAPGPRLERVSLGETLLITRAEAAPQPQYRGRSVTMTIDPPAARPDRPAAPLRVVNAVGRRGQAARMRAHLQKAGWAQAEVGDHDRHLALSRIVAPPGQRAEAARLSAALPFRTPIFTSSQAQRILLLLGANSVDFDQRLKGRAS